jgi:hypothetical protein
VGTSNTTNSVKVLIINYCVSTGLRLDDPEFESRRGKRILTAQNVQAGCGAQTTSYWTGTGVLFRRRSGRGVKMTVRLHLLSRLRMSSTIPLCSPYAFMARAATIISLILCNLIILSSNLMLNIKLCVRHQISHLFAVYYYYYYATQYACNRVRLLLQIVTWAVSGVQCVCFIQLCVLY